MTEQTSANPRDSRHEGDPKQAVWYLTEESREAALALHNVLVDTLPPDYPAPIVRWVESVHKEK